MKQNEEPICYECDEYYEFDTRMDIFICPCCKHKLGEEYDY